MPNVNKPIALVLHYCVCNNALAKYNIIFTHFYVRLFKTAEDALNMLM